MFPLQDETRRPTRFPAVTVLIIVLNAGVFVLELMGGDQFVLRWSAVPADIAAGRHLITVLTSMFLHGSWLHIIGNMVFLWVFGPEMEDEMGRGRYAAFYLLGGTVSMLAQVFLDRSSEVPALGASGAIAAVMGAFMVTYPSDRIRTVVLIGWFVQIARVPAALLIGLWFVLQLINFGLITDVKSGGVAYMAHIAGIIFGAVTAWLFTAPGKPEKTQWGD